MAFDTVAIAVTWNMGRYAVHAHGSVRLDTQKLRDRGILREVLISPGYVDVVGIVGKEELPDYFLPPGHFNAEAARKWHAALPDEVALVVIHEQEWESGLGG